MKDLNGNNLEVGQNVIVMLTGRIASSVIESIDNNIHVKITKDNFQPKGWAKSHYGDSDAIKIMAKTSMTRLAIVK